MLESDRGLRGVERHAGQGMPELEPAETGPLPVPATGRASLVEEAETTRHETGAGSPRVHSWEDVTKRLNPESESITNN